MQHADKRQVAVAFSKIKPVTDNEQVGNLKPNVVGGDVTAPARRLVQQHTGFDATRFEVAQLGQDTAHGLAGVENVVHQQNVTTANIQAQFLGKNEIA